MLSIKIASADLCYLIESNFEKTIIDSLKHNHFKKFDTVYLNIEKPIAELILDYLGNELMRAGIRENGEPNDFGIMLESIIDKFSREVYGPDPN
ncbi:MAG: hypothetical protein WKF97_01410 [Chitinophagaceae bacterium]